jgi:hypothetical protein
MSTISSRDLPAASAVYEKWGEAARAGWQAVPDLLFKHQGTLNLNPTELVVLLNVLMHWWYRHQKPFPRPTTIARRMGSTVRTVQRAIAKLEKQHLVVRQFGQLGPNKVVLDPEPLVRRLSEFAKDDSDYLVRTGGAASAAGLRGTLHVKGKTIHPNARQLDDRAGI